MEITRHDLRIISLQVLFALESNPSAELDEILDSLLEHYRNGKENIEVIQELVRNILSKKRIIDEEISAKLNKNWDISRLNKIDLMILRLAVYEIKYTDTPNKVAISEALKLSRQFSDDKTRRFVNGVLDAIIK